MKPQHTLARTLGAALVGVLALGAGCGESEPDSSQAPAPAIDATQAPTHNPLAADGTTPNPHAGLPGMGTEGLGGAAGTTPDGKGIIVHGVAITPPASWTKEVTTSTMRAAQYLLPPASEDQTIDATFVVFQGIGGSAEENIRRWIGQIKDKTETPIRETGETADGLTISTLRMVGTYFVGSMMGGSGKPEPDSMFLGAVITGAEEQYPVILRLVGPRAAIEPRLGEWNAMLETVRRAP